MAKISGDRILQIATHPAPEDIKLTGGYDVKFLGIDVTAKNVGRGVEVKFSGTARGGGDLAPFEGIRLPANGTLPGQKPKGTKISLNIASGTSSEKAAQTLAKAVKASGALYSTTVKGSTVTITPNDLLPRVATAE